MLFSDGLVINMLKTQELAYFLFKTMPLYLNSHSMSPFPIILPRCLLYAACLFYFGFLSPPSCNLCLPLGNHTFIKKKSLMHLFSDEYLIDLFSKCGFTLEEICVHNKQVENHSLDLVMNRWFLFLPALLMIFTIYLHSELIEKWVSCILHSKHYLCNIFKIESSVTRVTDSICISVW